MLFNAADKGHTEIVKLLLDKGANTEAIGNVSHSEYISVLVIVRSLRCKILYNIYMRIRSRWCHDMYSMAVDTVCLDFQSILFYYDYDSTRLDERKYGA